MTELPATAEDAETFQTLLFKTGKGEISGNFCRSHLPRACWRWKAVISGRLWATPSSPPSPPTSDSSPSAPSFLPSAVTTLGRNLYLGATCLVGFVLFVSAGHYKFLLPTPLMSPFSASRRQTENARAGPIPADSYFFLTPPLPQTSHLYCSFEDLDTP